MRRRGTHCGKGHPYTGKVDKHGQNVCLECKREHRIENAIIRGRLKNPDCSEELVYADEPIDFLPPPHPVVVLARRWDATVREYARIFSPERAARHFGLELQTVQEVCACDQRDNH
jgi:hypothetical protein